MSDKTSGLVSPDNMGYMYRPWMVQDLEGKILTAIESFGLRETQEKAAKDVIRSYMYRFYDFVKYIPSELVEEVEKYNAITAHGSATPHI